MEGPDVAFALNAGCVDKHQMMSPLEEWKAEGLQRLYIIAVFEFVGGKCWVLKIAEEQCHTCSVC